jgi:hypothetical protein
MELIKETRSKFVVKVSRPVKVDIDGVRADGDTIDFFKTHYKTLEDCQKWVEAYSKGEGFIPRSRVAKGFENVHTKAVKVTDDVWTKMSRFMVAPGEFTPDDFAVFKSQLANTAPDRDGQRFSLDFLKSLQKSIIGKSKLTGHDHSTTGEGRFFDAEIEKLSVDEFVETLDFVPDRNFLKKLGKIETEEGGVHWLLTQYYMPKTMEREINAIKSGIKGHFMSIGFAPPQGPIAIKEGGEGEILYHEWQNAKDFEVEAIEGSDVYLGAQYGAGNRKSYKDATDIPAISVDEEKSAESDDSLDPQTDDQSVNNINTANSEVKMKFELKSLDLAAELEVQDEQKETIENAFAIIEAKVTSMVDEHAQEIATKEAELDEVQKSVDGLKAEIEAQKAESVRAKAFREDVENFVLKAQYALKQFAFEEIEAKRAALAGKTDAELFEIRKGLTAELAKQPKFNAGQLSPDYNFDDGGQPAEKKLQYQAPYVLD